jgi:rod shape-determining protein MreC
MHIFTKKTRLFLIIITVVMVLTMAFSTLPFKRATFVENVFGIVMKPFQKISGFCVTTVDNFFLYFINVKTVHNNNELLKEEIDVLNADLRQLSDLKSENERLKDLLELKNSDTEHEYMAAQIISKSWNNWENTLTLNIGIDEGIEINDVVTTRKGIVGYVYEVGTNWSKVITVLDPSMSVSSLVKRTGDDGIVQGDYNVKNGQFCKISFVDKESGISVGDTIETSGAGGIFPAGLYIGKISELKSVSDGVSRQAIIETGTDFNNLSHVMVIK